jgi:hypothetical protein
LHEEDVAVFEAKEAQMEVLENERDELFREIHFPMQVLNAPWRMRFSTLFLGSSIVFFFFFRFSQILGRSCQSSEVLRSWLQEKNFFNLLTLCCGAYKKRLSKTIDAPLFNMLGKGSQSPSFSQI